MATVRRRRRNSWGSLAALGAVVVAATFAPWASSYPFTPASSFASGGTNPHGVAAADFNGDGRVDLAAANAGSANVGVLLGNGDGTFRTAVAYATGGAPKTVAAARLDGDSTVDLVTANQETNNVTVLKGRGDGTFTGRADYPVCAAAHETATGDFDGDGDVDLAVACWNGSVIGVLRNNGTGAFGAPVTYTSGSAPHSIDVGDFNGDGRLDLAVANNGSNSVGILTGRGDGTFNTVASYAVGAGPHSLRIGDLNGDARRDVVTANERADNVSVLLGRGDGTFGAATQFATGKVPKGVAIADVNGDGRQDVATANTAGNYPSGVLNPGGNEVSVLLGNGAGAVGAPTQYTVGHTPFAVARADVDGDSREDLVTANYFGNDLSVLRHASGFQQVTVFSGLTNPTAVRFARDGRIFVAEKSGLVKVFDGLTDSSPDLFADLSTNVHNYWDRGLLGLALHPNFPTTPYVYVLYTHDAAIGGTAPRWGTVGVLSDPCPTPPGPTADGCVVSGRLSRLEASGNRMTGSERVLIEDWCQQYPSLSVGDLHFGADGALYVSGGEGGSFLFTDYGQAGSPKNPCGDPPAGVGGTMTPPTAEGGSLRAQDLRTTSDPTGLSGTVLRVDPLTGAAATGNPLAFSSDENARRILSYGFRNPFRFAIRPGTNELWIGDVGTGGPDEVDVLPADRALRNYGWPCYIGTGRNGSFDAIDLSLCETLYSTGGVTGPVYSYAVGTNVVEGEPCTTGSTTISGLAFYGGARYPSRFNGALFFADYSRNCVWAMIGADPSRRELVLSGLSSPVDLQVGPEGDLFYADLNGGTIRRIVYGGGGGGGTPPPPPPPPTGATRYLSDGAFVSSSNGWGPVERDMSNGENGAGDGRTLTLNGTTFAKGLGVHALSEVVVAVPSDCSRFRSSVGVDDEVGSNGSVVFRVVQGTTTLFDSGTMTGASATQLVDVAVTAGAQLRLVVTDGGDWISYDHGDWASARFECSTSGGGDTTAPTVTGTTPAAGATGVATSVSPTATFSEAMTASSITASTFTLTAQGASSPVAATVSYDATALRATLSPGAALQAGTQYTARVRGGSSGVKDAAGNALAADVTWTFTTAAAGGGNTAPTPTIATPASGTTWAVGDSVSFSGSATDAEDGALPASRLSWTLVLHHCSAPSSCHTHDVQSFAGVASGSFTAPDHEYPSYLELRLTATDSAGASATATRRLDPKTVKITFATQPAGLQLAAAGATQTAPFEHTFIVGSRVTIAAPSPQSLSGTEYVWESWSDGGARTHEITVGTAAATLTATFGSGTTVTRYLSDLTWSSATNGWGPVEKDMSNGESSAGDGRTITLNGVTFQKGLGVHATSDVRYDIPANCSRFRASIGVDDEVGTSGSVMFRVLLDGVQAYDSDRMTGSSATKLVDLDVGGKAQLRLVVTDAADGAAFDHADWADARLSCAATSTGDTTPPTITGRTPAPGATGVSTSTASSATFSEAVATASLSGSTFFLTAQGASSPVAATVSYDGGTRTATLTPSAALAASTTYTATVKGGSSGVKDLAGNPLASDVTWSFTTAAAGGGTTTTRFLSDLTWSSATNGWGPVEKDMSNGESGSGDGRTITLNGTTFTKGLGVHAASDVRFIVPSGCTRFAASVGVDDEVGSLGSVVFQVFLDATNVYESGTMTGATATATVDVPVTAGATLRLVVTDAGDGPAFDHADWASARLSC